MITCRQAKDLILRVIDGDIVDSELACLRAHADACPSCRREFDRCNLLQRMVAAAFSGPQDAAQAGERILARLPSRPPSGTSSWLTRSMAAAVLLVVGLTLGLAAGLLVPDEMTLAAKLPARPTNLTGTVLVKRAGARTWRPLQNDSPIRLGDTFHAIAGSGFVLHLDDKSRIQVNQNSTLILKSYNGQTQLFLEHGECTAELESPHGPFFVETPHGRVEALGTEFTVTVE